jgi:hypothetical protein
MISIIMEQGCFVKAKIPPDVTGYAAWMGRT